ncbi:MAG: DUF5131 family protein, partial [Chloroflexota bacterium]
GRTGGIDWLIVGGESGGPEDRRLVWRRTNGGYPIAPGKDLLHGLSVKPEAMRWVRSLRDQAEASGTAFFFKQWGGAQPHSGGSLLDGRKHEDLPRKEI